MEFLRNIEKAKQRLEAWWHNELVDRPVVHMTCQREKPRWPLRTLPNISNTMDRWYLDLQYRVDAIENELASTEYFGDAIPHFHRGINTGYLSVFAGVTPSYTRNGVWVDTCVVDWKKAQKPKFDTELPLFKKMVEISRGLWENAQGRYMLDLPDFLDGITIMSQMRGVEGLCTDLYDDPQAPHAFRDAFIQVWLDSFDYWTKHDKELGQDGHINWAGAYTKKRRGVIQCDFSVMLSPEMFTSFVRPELAAEAAHLEGALYHLDGYQQLHHLNALLEIPGLAAVQWISGANNPTAADKPETIRTIQAKGKPVQIIAFADEVEKLTSLYRPEGVFLWVFFRDGQKQDVDACRHVMKLVEKWK